MPTQQSTSHNMYNIGIAYSNSEETMQKWKVGEKQ